MGGIKEREKKKHSHFNFYQAAMFCATALWWKLLLWRAAPSVSLWSSVCGSSDGRWPHCRSCGCCCEKLYFLWKQFTFSVFNDPCQSSELLINAIPMQDFLFIVIFTVKNKGYGYHKISYFFQVFVLQKYCSRGFLKSTIQQPFSSRK